MRYANTVALALAIAALDVACVHAQQFKVGAMTLTPALIIDIDNNGVGVGGDFEVGVADIAGQVKVGVGGSLAVIHRNVTSISDNIVPILGFVHGHYQLKDVPALDLFAGPVLGVSMHRESVNDVDNNFTHVVGGIQAGARYQWTPNISGSGQLGAGVEVPTLSLGVTFKF